LAEQAPAGLAQVLVVRRPVPETCRVVRSPMPELEAETTAQRLQRLAAE